MHNQSRDELERIAKARRIKSYNKMLKEELIIALLRSQRSVAELFNNDLDNDKISDIKRILNRLGHILPKEYRKLYEIKNKKNLSELEREEINDDLTELVRILDKKEKILSI